MLESTHLWMDSNEAGSHHTRLRQARSRESWGSIGQVWTCSRKEIGFTIHLPKGPSTQYLRTLVSKTIPFGPESFNIGYLDPLGLFASSMAVFSDTSCKALRLGETIPTWMHCDVGVREDAKGPKDPSASVMRILGLGPSTPRSGT